MITFACKCLIFLVAVCADSPRRLSGKDIVAELMEKRQQTKKQLRDIEKGQPQLFNDARGPEVLDLTAVMSSRATYYDPISPPSPDTIPMAKLQRNGASSSREKVAKAILMERDGRFSAGAAAASKSILPSVRHAPLVVIVAGAGAEQAWSSLLMVDSARLSVVSDGCGGSSSWFDLILLVPHGDSSSLIPCQGSQGCRSEGVGLGPSGLRVLKGDAAASSNEDNLAAEALKLWDKTLHSSLLVVSASAIVSPAALRKLTDAVRPNSPAALGVAVPLVHGLFGAKGANALEKWYDVRGGEGGAGFALAFAAHPLNAARVQSALEALPPYAGGVDYESGVFEESSENGGGDDGDAGLSAVALSAKAVKRLLGLSKQHQGDTHGHSKGFTHLLRKLTRTATDIDVGIVRRAFVHWNLGYRTNVARPQNGPFEKSPQLPVKMGLGSRTLLAICAAGVPDKTVGAILALESGLMRRQRVDDDGTAWCGGHPFTCAAFDLVVGVSPFPGDNTAAFLEAAGIFVLRQPTALGLSDLWNRIVRFAFTDHNYAHLIISNNDVLIPPGSVGATTTLLDLMPRKIATVLSQKGGATESLGNKMSPLESAAEDAVAFAEHPLNYRAVQALLTGSMVDCSKQTNELSVPYLERKSFVGFFWGITSELAKGLLLEDGSGRLFNTTARLNFGQEAELMDRLNGGAQVTLNVAAYVHHFRGQTLGGCQNGHRDCAQWQVGHHADQTYHINHYAPQKIKHRVVPWWEPDFGNQSPHAWKDSTGGGHTKGARR